MNRRNFIALASVGGAGAFLAACNDENDNDLEPTMIDDVEGAPPTLAPFGTPPDTAEEEEAAEVEAGQTEFEVIGLDELAFEPSEMTIPADTDVTVLFINDGSLEHDWVVDGYEGDADTEIIPGGEETEVTFSLPEGEYEFYCSVPGHREGGMVGTLHVVPEDELGEPAEEEEEEPAEEEEEEPEEDEEAAADAETELEVVGLDSLAFEPSELTIPADTEVTLTFINDGSLEHDWVVEGYEGDADTDIIPGGEETEVTFSLPAGEYEFYCSVPGHREGGMVGTITVE